MSIKTIIKIFCFILFFAPASAFSQTELIGPAVSIGAKMLMDNCIDPGGAAATKDDISKLRNLLKETQNQLKAVSMQIDSGNEKIVSEIIRSQFNTGSLIISDHITTVENTFNAIADAILDKTQGLEAGVKTQSLAQCIAQTPAQASATYKTLKLNASVAGLFLPSYGTLHQKLFGDKRSGGNGVLSAFAEKKKTETRFVSSSYYKAVKAQYDYYRKIEEMEYYLVREAISVLGQDEATKRRCQAKYTAARENGAKWFAKVKPLPEDFFVYPEKRIMYYFPKDNYTTMSAPCADGWYSLMNDFKAKKIGGYEDWRQPEKSELAQMITGSSGVVGDWLQKQGFLSMTRSRYLAARSNWGDAFAFYIVTTPYLNTSNGLILEGFSTVVMGSGAVINPGPVVQQMPVRSMTDSDMTSFFW